MRVIIPDQYNILLGSQDSTGTADCVDDVERIAIIAVLLPRQCLDRQQ